MRPVLALTGLLFMAGSALAEPARPDPTAPPSLAEIGADALARRRPPTVATAPDVIRLSPDLAEALRAEPIDGGREKTLYLQLSNGRLSLARSIVGSRYRATGSCSDCDFVQPFRGHTHPYENPFSVIDLRIAAGEGRPSVMVTTHGQIWLALPTGETRQPDPDIALRFALFGNRLECAAPAPADGWAAPTTMGRRVEVVARVAANQLGLALYVADPGEDFRKLDPVEGGIDALSPDAVVPAADLNAHERTLLGLLHVVATRKPSKAATLGAPGDPLPALDGQLSAPARFGVMRIASRIASSAGDNWLAALPTTVYPNGYGDVSASALTFVSVQNSPDCSRIMMLEGMQTFAPDSVRYSRGWSRERLSTAADDDGWTEMAADAFPDGQVVPW